MTERLYYRDSFLTEFDACTAEVRAGGTQVILDRTAFYPSSGGQPHDTGLLNGVPVVDVLDEEERIVHVLASPLPERGPVHGAIDWARRFDHMQQHSGQHLLSAVLEELYGMRTVSFHLGAESSTIDVDAAALDPARLARAEMRANELVWAAKPLSVAFEDAAAATGLRKEAQRTGILRIVTIEDYDRSACGGTHVRSTAEIGAVLLRRTEKVRARTRVDFLCGGRAIRQARKDFETLSQAARLFSAPPDQVPALISSLAGEARESARTRRKLALELAHFKGKALYDAAAPDEAGRRIYVQQRQAGPPDEETRALALGFCSGARALFIATCADPPAILFAASPDSGIDAGSALKEALHASGGRGGGTAQTAQGSLPAPAAIPEVLARLLQR